MVWGKDTPGKRDCDVQRLGDWKWLRAFTEQRKGVRPEWLMEQ